MTIYNRQADSPLHVWPDVWSGDLEVLIDSFYMHQMSLLRPVHYVTESWEGFEPWTLGSQTRPLNWLGQSWFRCAILMRDEFEWHNWNNFSIQW